MKARFYPMLNSRSKRAYWQPGYCPRSNLLARLAHQTGMEIQEVGEAFMEERERLIRLLNDSPEPEEPKLDCLIDFPNS